MGWDLNKSLKRRKIKIFLDINFLIRVEWNHQSRGVKMFKRELIFLALIVAVATLLFVVPPQAHAITVYPIKFKEINEDLPEIKWEDGEPGDESTGKVNLLGSSEGFQNEKRIVKDRQCLVYFDNTALEKFTWRYLIINQLLFLIK